MIPIVDILISMGNNIPMIITLVATFALPILFK